MPELPWEKWFPTNWASEPGLRLCEAATRGIWFEAVNTMMLQQTDRVRGTVEQLASLCICRVPQMQLAIEQLKQFKIAEVNEHNGNITLTNRKRVRDCRMKELRRKAGLASATKRWHTPQQGVITNTVTPSASASASAYSKGGCGGDMVIFDQLETRLVDMFNRPVGSVTDYAEQSGLSELSRRPNVLTELAEIEKYKTQEKKYFPQSLLSLISKWQEILDRARSWKPDPEQQKKRVAELVKLGL